jgi:hypothetical protein
VTLSQPVVELNVMYDVAMFIRLTVRGGAVLPAVHGSHDRQGLTLVHYSAQPQPFWSHLPVSACLIDWGEIMQPTYPTKCAYVEPKYGRV